MVLTIKSELKTHLLLDLLHVIPKFILAFSFIGSFNVSEQRAKAVLCPNQAQRHIGALL